MKRMNQQKSKLHVNFKCSFHVKSCYVKQRFCLTGPTNSNLCKSLNFIVLYRFQQYFKRGEDNYIFSVATRDNPDALNFCKHA